MKSFTKVGFSKQPQNENADEFRCQYLWQVPLTQVFNKLTWSSNWVIDQPNKVLSGWFPYFWSNPLWIKSVTTLKENIKLALIQQIKTAYWHYEDKILYHIQVPILEIFQIFCKIDCGSINASSIFKCLLSYRNKK